MEIKGYQITCLKSFPDKKCLDLIKFKAFAVDNLNLAKTTISVCDRTENNVGNGENAGYQHFLLFPEFKSLLFEFVW